MSSVSAKLKKTNFLVCGSKNQLMTTKKKSVAEKKPKILRNYIPAVLSALSGVFNVSTKLKNETNFCF